MNTTETSCLDGVDQARKALLDADAVLVGAGAGLSAAAGLLYLDEGTFQAWFPGYHEHYGLRFIYEAAFHDFPSPEEHYAYWARHIQTIRFQFPAGKPYRDLMRLLRGREHFVLSTNADGQFAKAGFDHSRLLTPQGDYAYFQCPQPCSDEIYPNRSMVESMLVHITPENMSIRSEDLPHCPKCGRLLVPNLRKDATFVQARWMKGYDDLETFIDAQAGKRLLLLELGVGFNTPTIIRFPFERLAATRDDTTLIRVNLDAPELSIPEAEKRTLAFGMDISVFLSRLLQRVPTN